MSAGEYAAIPDVNERDHFTFGGGRRICPGLHLAERSVFLNLARLMWGFDITHAKDENADIVPVDYTTKGLMPGGLSNARPFKCCRTLRRLLCTDLVAITVRSAKRELLLRKEWAEAQNTGIDFSTIRFDNI